MLVAVVTLLSCFVAAISSEARFSGLGAERRGLEPALGDGAAAHSVDLGPTKSTVLRDTVLEWKGERVGRAETLYRRERAS